MKKSWKKEVARDLMALGSFPFIILVLVRVLMVANFKIIFHVIVSLILFYLISLSIKGMHNHLGRLTILVIFTSYFYSSLLYTIFAIVTAISTAYGIKKYHKGEKLFTTMAISFLCAILAYLIELPLNIPNL